MSTNTKAAEMLEQVNSAISAVLAGGRTVLQNREPFPDAGGPGPAESHS